MNIFDDYLYPLAEQYRVHANPTYAEAMSAYMRNQFEFFGNTQPQRRVIDRQFIKDKGLPSIKVLEQLLPELWQQTERDFQYFAIELAAACKYYQQENALSLIESMIVQRSWWDTVDTISSLLVAPYFKQFPAQRHNVAYRWIESENTWLQRTAIIFQRKYKQQTDRELLFALIRRRADSKEFFIQKGIGWALREYAYMYPEAVREFVESTPLANLSKREALKRISYVAMSPAAVLGHEADHGAGFDADPGKYIIDYLTDDKQYEDKEEKRVITGPEQKRARKLGETKKGEITRRDHYGELYETTGPTSTTLKEDEKKDK